MTTAQLARSIGITSMSTMTQEDNKQNMEEQKAPIPHIKPADAWGWGLDRSAQVDDGWDRICGANSLARTFKTKGSWEFARGTLSYSTHPPDPRSGSIPPLVALVAKQMAAHLTEEEVMKFAPLHVHLIQKMGTNKRKQDKGKGEKTLPLVYAQKKAKGMCETL